MTLILGANIPRGMPKQSISSPSPNSLSIKKYDMPNIRFTKPRYYDRGHKNWISQPKYCSRIFSFLFQHVIRIAFVYSFKGVKFCFSCSSFTFLAKTSAGFLWEQPCTPTFEKKKLTPFESFGCTLRELHTNFLLVKSQIFVGKKLVNTA